MLERVSSMLQRSSSCLLHSLPIILQDLCRYLSAPSCYPWRFLGCVRPKSKELWSWRISAVEFKRVVCAKWGWGQKWKYETSGNARPSPVLPKGPFPFWSLLKVKIFGVCSCLNKGLVGEPLWSPDLQQTHSISDLSINFLGQLGTPQLLSTTACLKNIVFYMGWTSNSRIPSLGGHARDGMNGNTIHGDGNRCSLYSIF